MAAVGSGEVEQCKFRLAVCSDFDIFYHIFLFKDLLFMI